MRMSELNNNQGFTLIEVVVVLSIIGIISAMAGVQYLNHVRKAKITEAVVFQGKLRTDFQEAYANLGDFPIQVADSTSRRAARQSKTKKRVKRSEWFIKLPGSELMEEYWYEANLRQNWAYLAISFSKSEFPECTGNCSVTIGYQVSRSGKLYSYCGRWTGSRKWGRFPLQLLPPNCRESCVRCKLRQARRL